ncbi:hypothetical protein G4B88_028036 [Cannabis sativa]|uniref:Lipoxygenase n=1 Tax=Cannabis sativa TaxID=3483 RepID=A0A7J6DTZ0_CANSA|nr:hypothetical protein G4B88_028036 [Cannabis sativa]
MLHYRNLNTPSPLLKFGAGVNSLTSLVFKNSHNSLGFYSENHDRVLKSSCLIDLTRSQPLVGGGHCDRREESSISSSGEKMSVRCNTGSHSHNRISIEKEDGNGKTTTTKGSGKIKGNVVLMKKNVLDFNDFNASFLDRVHELFGQRVSLQLVSAVNGDPASSTSRLSLSTMFLAMAESTSSATLGFTRLISTIPLEFSSLISETPLSLRKYREEELANLRGNGTGERQEWDRIYDYDYYNDLGNPDKGAKYARPVLGGSPQYPYPRRGRTGRKRTDTDRNTETRLNLALSLNIYAPRDERFGHLKLADFLAYALKSIGQFLKPEIEDLFNSTPNEFDSIDDVFKLYEGGVDVPEGLLKSVRDNIPAEMLKEIFRTDGERFLKFPVPQVIKENKTAWDTDEEFAREMLAGINPVMIHRLQEFPPRSKLDPKVYGDHTSKITKNYIEHNLDGLSVDEAIRNNKVFILDHHDTLIPFLRRINATNTKIYATRTIIFLQKDGTLKPLAIELSLPHPGGDHFGCISKVYTPADKGVDGSLWQLAKAYVNVNDSGYHQLISHWLKTHAAIEPFVIATNRQLSVVHPINKLLHPHFRDTMNLNAVARQILINAGGALEATVFPGRYCMEMTSASYKEWTFPDQALPVDLIKRGVAVEDENSPHGLRLLIDDYPFAVDGLEIWSAIKTWVKDYCSLYYKTDKMVQEDYELQSWWKELREEGHGDKKDEPWWPEMQTRKDLIETCTIIIWIASALHAAINFGQYPYGGFPPNRPSMSRRFIPEEGTPEYNELKTDPEKALLKTITGQLLSVLGISLVEILSRHSSDEVYLGERDTPEWTTDKEAEKAFEKFGNKLREIELKIEKMNKDQKLKNRVGPVKMPYTLLYPSSEGGLTGKGIPNSVSI